MISAEWLFKNHNDHVTIIKLIEIQLENATVSVTMSEQERDEKIAAMVLARPPFDGLPKVRGRHSSSTEKTVLALEESDTMLRAHTIELQKQLSVYRYLLKIYDTLISILSVQEQQFVYYYYNQQLSLTAMTEVKDSPVYGLSKTTVWTYKSKLLRKCNSLLRCLCASPI